MPTKKAFPFKIGADPEFNFVIQNKQNARLKADSLMRDFFRSDHEEGNSGFKMLEGNAGWDGNSSTGELRPNPEKSPADLTKNIGAMYAKICQRSPRAVKVSLRSDTAPVGGHIHFELDAVSKIMSMAKGRVVQKQLSTFYIPIALGEDPRNQAMRLQTQYGRFGDFRMENSRTYEYRTPSAEWQITPKICEATLAYMGTVWYEAIHRPQSFKNFEAVYANERAGNALQHLLVTRYEPMKGVVSTLRTKIKTFEYYPMFKEEIDYIMNWEKVLRDKEKAMFCINLGWELSDNKQPIKKNINNERQISAGLQSIDIDRWLELFKIPYNPDTNVKDFVDALKKRVLAFDWNLNNEYYLFGLRKGIDNPIILNGRDQFISGHNQVITKRDYSSIIDTFSRMKGRMQRSYATSPEKSILIGLPYNMRMQKEVRPFIETLYDIERTEPRLAPRSLTADDLENDIESAPEDWGKIAKAYAAPGQEITAELARPRREGAEFMVEVDPDPGDLYPDPENPGDGSNCRNCGAEDCDCEEC